MTVEDLFAVLEALPLATGVPEIDPWKARAIGERRMTAALCAFGCGRPSPCAFLVGPSPIVGEHARWLDTCWPHSEELRTMVYSAAFPDDVELASRWFRWKDTQDV